MCYPLILKRKNKQKLWYYILCIFSDNTDYYLEPFNKIDAMIQNKLNSLESELNWTKEFKVNLLIFLYIIWKINLYHV